MKFLVLVSLVSLAHSHAGEDKMVKTWQKMKALESCWGEENMKLYTVEMKKAIAKCGHEDAPELNLPPFRSTYRFVNSMLNNANHMENQQYKLIEKMLEFMQGNQYNYNRPSYSQYSRNDDNMNNRNSLKQNFMKHMMQKMMNGDMYDSNYPTTYSSNNNNRDFMEMFAKMFGDNMYNKMDNYRSNSDSSMSRFFDMFKRNRVQRAASEDGAVSPSLDLGDRLVEKLNEQRHEMQAKIGNMTCVLKHMGCLNNQNELDLANMREEMKQYTMPSPWFSQKYDQILETCYEMANNLPADIEEQSVVNGENFGSVNLAKIKTFSKCQRDAEFKLCMNHDIKKKIESNFGPMEEILEQTQLTEYQLFPLVIQLLHGEEMEYMMGEF